MELNNNQFRIEKYLETDLEQPEKINAITLQEEQNIYDISKYLEDKPKVIQPLQEKVPEIKEQAVIGNANLGDSLETLASSFWHSLAYASNNIAEKLAYAEHYDTSLAGLVFQAMDTILQKKGLGIDDLLEITKREEYKKLDENKKKNYIMSAIGEVIGALPAGILEWIGNVPWAMYSELVDQLKAQNKPTDVIKHTLMAGLKRGILGKLFAGLDKLSVLKQALGAGAIGFSDYASEVAMHTKLDEEFINNFKNNFDSKEALKSTLSLFALNVIGNAKKIANKEEIRREIQKNIDEKSEAFAGDNKEEIISMAGEIVDKVKQIADPAMKPAKNIIEDEITNLEKLIKEEENKTDLKETFKEIREQYIEKQKEYRQKLKIKIKELEKEVKKENERDRLIKDLESKSEALKREIEQGKQANIKAFQVGVLESILPEPLKPLGTFEEKNIKAIKNKENQLIKIQNKIKKLQEGKKNIIDLLMQLNSLREEERSAEIITKAPRIKKEIQSPEEILEERETRKQKIESLLAKLKEEQELKQDIIYSGDDILSNLEEPQKIINKNPLQTIYDKLNYMKNEREYHKNVINEIGDILEAKDISDFIDKLDSIKLSDEAYNIFQKKYGIEPESIINMIRKDINLFQRFLSFPETLARKDNAFKKLFQSANNLFNDAMINLNDIILKFDLQNTHKILSESKNLQEYMKDIKSGILKIKWGDINYLKEKGFNDDEVAFIQKLIKNKKRENIYLFLNTDRQKLKLTPEKLSALEKLDKLREEEKNLFNERDAFTDKEIMRTYGFLNDDEINALINIKKANDYMYLKIYKDMMDNYDYYVRKREEAGKPLSIMTILLEKLAITNHFKNLYDPYYFNKHKDGAKYLIKAMGKGAEPVIFYASDLLEAKQKLNKIKKMGWEGEIIKTKRNVYEDYFLPNDMMAKYNAIIPSDIKERMEEKGKELSGFWQHLEHANFFPSDDIDIPRNTAIYTNQWSNFLARRANKIISKEILDEYQFHPAYKNTNIYKSMEKYYNDIYYPRQNFITKLTGYLGLYYLWGNIKSASLQFTQPFIVTFPYLLKYANYIHSTKVFINGYRDSIKYIMERDKLKAENPELYNDITKALNETNVIDKQWINFLLESARGKGFTKTIIEGGLVPFGKADKFQRFVGFVAGWHLAKKLGFNPYEKGLEISKETNFDYTKANRPEIARGLLSPFFALRMFEGHQFRLFKEYMKEKEWKAFVTQMSAYAVLGGIRGLPFAITTLAVLNSLGVDVQKKFMEWADSAGKNLILAITRGIPSIIGIDISGSVSFGRMIPAFDSNFEENFYRNILGVPANILQRGAYAIRNYIKGKYGEGFANNLPISLGNLIIAKMKYDEGLYFTQNIPGYGQYKQYIMKPSDIYASILKGLSFNPTKYAIYYEILRLEKQYGKEKTAKIKRIWKERSK